eukprot:m.752945 g.752945  ORF g.752945 m.752945 type:complete len:158 (+) comp23171_c0_seq17:2035-2508(+)
MMLCGARAWVASCLRGCKRGDKRVCKHAMSPFAHRYRWFVGDMDRAAAKATLDSFPVGSFLVRHGSKGFVFSVRYTRTGATDTMFNVEIHSVLEPDTSGRLRKKYFVSDDAKFDDLPSLVEFYMKNSEMFFGNLVNAQLYQNERLLSYAKAVEEIVS